MRLLKTYPTRQNMTQRFFSEKMSFLCRLCQHVRNSRFRVESLEGVICSLCYRRKLDGKTITQYRDSDRTWGKRRG